MENLFQSDPWAKLKTQTGYSKSHRIEGVLILQKSLLFGRTMLYSPMVDLEQITTIRGYGWSHFLKKVEEIAKIERSIFYRLELDISHDLYELPQTLKFKKAFEEMQPVHTLTLNLNASEEKLLNEMKPKGRYNLKIAQKQVKVEKSTQKGRALDDFYLMYEETGKRHKISYRSKEYFEALVEILGALGYARVYTGYTENNIPVASAIVVYSGSKAIYLFASSSNEFRSLKAPNLINWEAICQAKDEGYEEYDFFGIAPNDDPSHPWAGITRFKKQFGGKEKEILGSYDLIFSPMLYAGFKAAEKIRRKG